MRRSDLSLTIRRAVAGDKASLLRLSHRLPHCPPDGAEIMAIVRPIARVHGLRAWTARDTWADVANRWAKELARRAEESA